LEFDNFDAIMIYLEDNDFTICAGKIDTPVCEIGTMQEGEGKMITIYSKKAVYPKFSTG
tara:strand:- start:13728 stop:13904 length:177 start_codon:yes stop_codon:yes gene_type:complete